MLIVIVVEIDAEEARESVEEGYDRTLGDS
jgi:hypothetical protein